MPSSDAPRAQHRTPAPHRFPPRVRVPLGRACFHTTSSTPSHSHDRGSLIRFGCLGLSPCDTGDRPRARPTHDSPSRPSFPPRCCISLWRDAPILRALPAESQPRRQTPDRLETTTPARRVAPFSTVPVVPVAPGRSRITVALLRLVTPKRVECDGLQRVSIPTAGVSTWSAHCGSLRVSSASAAGALASWHLLPTQEATRRFRDALTSADMPTTSGYSPPV